MEVALVPWYWIPICLCAGASIGLLVFGLLLAAKDEIRVVDRWRGTRGTELIDTSDGQRWTSFGRPDAAVVPPLPWPYVDEEFSRVA